MGHLYGLGLNLIGSVTMKRVAPGRDSTCTSPPCCCTTMLYVMFRLCREERLEDARLNFQRDALPGIAYFYVDKTVARRGAQRQFALALHGVNGVVDDVRPHLIEFAAARFDAGQVGRVIAHDAHTVFEFVPQNDQRVFQAVVHVHFLNRRLIEIRIISYGVDDFRKPLRAQADVAQQRIDRAAGCQPGRHCGRLIERENPIELRQVTFAPAHRHQRGSQFPG
jgi:hypothetical protein